MGYLIWKKAKLTFWTWQRWSLSTQDVVGSDRHMDYGEVDEYSEAYLGALFNVIISFEKLWYVI